MGGFSFKNILDPLGLFSDTGPEIGNWMTGKQESTDALTEIAKAQQGMAEDQWATYKEVFGPYEQAMVDANQYLLPQTTALQSAQTQAQLGLVDPRMRAQQAQLEEGIYDLQQGRGVKDALRQQQINELGFLGRELEAYEPVMQQYYQQVQEGVDPLQAMATAQADIEHSYGGAMGQMGRQAQRYGMQLNPGAMQDMVLDKSKAIGLARNQARRDAGAQSFNRLQAAASGGRSQGATNLIGMGDISAGNALPYGSPSTAQFGNYNMQSPAQMANSIYSNAANTYGQVFNQNRQQSSDAMGMAGAGMSLASMFI